MKKTIFLRTETDLAARALRRYLECFLSNSVDICFSSNELRQGIPNWIFQTDLLIFELLQKDALGFYAAGIQGAERYAGSGVRTLIISGAAEAEASTTLPFYWDLAAPDSLHDRVQRLLDSPPTPSYEFEALQNFFLEYCREAYSHSD